MKMQFKGNTFMRLYNTYYLCKKHINTLEENWFDPVTDNNGVCYSISEWESLQHILLELKNIDILSPSVNDFYESMSTYDREKIVPVLGLLTKTKLLNILIEICSKMHVIISLYESMGLDNSKSGIDVKLPQCNSLSEYILYLKELDFIFNRCPFFNVNDESIVFNSVDVGSTWVKFAVKLAAGATTATIVINNFATVVDKSVQVRSHYVSLKQQEQLLRKQNIENEALEIVLNSYKVLQKQYIQDAIKDLKELNPEVEFKDGEEEDVAGQCIEKMIALLDKGVEFYASIDAPEEIKVLFPPLDKYEKLSVDTLKLLEPINTKY